MNVQRVLVLIALSLLPAAVFSQHDEEHEDGLGKIIGPDIDISYRDHSFAGQVGGILLFAKQLESEYGLHMRHIQGEREFESVFRKDTSTQALSGVVSSLNARGQETAVEFKITKVLTVEGTIEGFIDGRFFMVQVSAKSRNENHYVDPHFDVRLDGRSFSFDLQGAKACMGCAVKICYVVLSMLAVSGHFSHLT